MRTASNEWYCYLRLSKGRAGIARQRAVTTRWIEHDQGGTVVGEFKDEDSTAAREFGSDIRPPRPGFDAMIAAMAARPGVNVGAWHADRLARDLPDGELLLVRTAAGGGVIGTAAGGIFDPSTASGRRSFRREVVDGAGEVDHMRERILAAKSEARAGGFWLGGPRPFGWDIDRTREPGEPAALRINLAEADLIRTGTIAILEGASLRSVTRAWNQSGITGTRGGAWANREVSATLRRARNAGLAEYGLGDGRGLQVTGPGNWPAIVAEDQWRTCKAILGNPARRSASDTRVKHLLSGIPLCGECGTPVVGIWVARRGRDRELVYTDRPKTGPGHVYRSAAALDAYIGELVIRWVSEHGREALQPAAPDVSLVTAQLHAIESEIEHLTAAAAARDIDAAQLIRASKPLQQQKREAQARLAAAAVTRVPVTVFTGDDIRGGWDHADLDAKRALIRGLMTITLLPGAPRGCPPGWRRGDGPYFRREYVKIDWKRG